MAVVTRLNAWMAGHGVVWLVGVVALALAFPAPVLRAREATLFGVAAPTWALAVMMLAASTQCRLEDFRHLFRARRAGAWSLALIYLAQPVLALILGAAVLDPFGSEAAHQLKVGLFFVSLMPVAMTATAWVRLAHGSLCMIVALIGLTTALALGTLPLYLAGGGALWGERLPMSDQGLVRQLLLAVTLPLTAGIAARWFRPTWVDRGQPALGLLGQLGLWTALATNVAGSAGALRGSVGVVFASGAVAVGLSALSFGLAIGVARWLSTHAPGLRHEEAISVVFSGGMRSTGTAMVLAAATCPHWAWVTLPAAMYSIAQQVMAGLLWPALPPSSFVWRPAVDRTPEAFEARLRLAAQGSASGLTLIRFELGPQPQGAHGAVLRAVTRRLRGYDGVGPFTAGRFVVFLPGADVGTGHRVARRIQGELARHVPVTRLRWRVERRCCGPRAAPDPLATAGLLRI